MNQDEGTRTAGLSLIKQIILLERSMIEIFRAEVTITEHSLPAHERAKGDQTPNFRENLKVQKRLKMCSNKNP